MKQFFEQYGGVALGILALLVLIAMITPVGNIIKTSLQGTVQTFSTSINAQVDDDLDAVSKIADGIGTEIPYPGNIVNYNGQSSFSSTYTEADIIWPSGYNFKDSITLYVEFKGRNTTSEKHDLISNYEQAGAGIHLNQDNTLVFQIFNLENNLYYNVSSADFNADEFTKVAGVYDGNKMKLYINNELKAEYNLPGNIKTSYAPVIIGNPEGNERVEIPNEKIYRVGMFDGALTLEQIESLQYK